MESISELIVGVLLLLCKACKARKMFFSSYYALLPIGLLLFAHGVRRLQAWHRRITFKVANGCQTMPHFSRFQNLVEQVKAIKSHTYLEMWIDRYTKIGKTFSSSTMSIDQIIFTIEPENIKTMLATDFDNFELGQRRRTLMGPVTGPGIFSNDGTAWKHSRVCTHAQQQRICMRLTLHSDIDPPELFKDDNFGPVKIRIPCAGPTQGITAA